MLWELTKGSRLRYGSAVVAMAAATLLAYAGPMLVGTTVDAVLRVDAPSAPALHRAALRLLGGREFLAENLWLPGLVLVGVTALGGALMYLQGRWAAGASEAVVRRLRRRLYDRLQNLPVGFHDKMETGELIQRCTSDVETVHMFLSQQVLEVSRAALLLLTAVPIMLALSPRMTGVSMVLVGPILIFAIVFFMKVRRAFRRSDEAEGAMTAALQENLTGIRVVRAFARQDHERARFGERNRGFRDLDYRLIRLLAVFWAISDVMCFAQRGLVLLVGAHLVRTQPKAFTIGLMVIFFGWVDKFLWPVRRIGRTLTELGKALVSVSRLRAILDHPAETETPAGPDALTKLRAEAREAVPHGRIEVRDVRFDHDGSAHVLRGVTFDVEPGQTLAILGPSGSGKSTLVNLLLRLYDYREGSIRLDGRELKALERRAVRSAIGVVLQEPFLYSRSLRDNIRLGNSAAGEDEIIEAANTASIHQSILAFEHGYQTQVGERGVTLSGGQRQRIALARAVLADPVVLVLDDALSAVDTRTESMILDALRRRSGRRTTLVIAHRLSTLRRADKILVLDEGRVVQCGSHEQLIGQDGLYRRLWAIQSSLEDDLSQDMHSVP